MKFQSVIDYYRDLRPSTLKTPKYCHLILALFWPAFGLVFMTLEQFWPRIWQALTGEVLVYQEVISSLDAYIPFCEWFVIPYYFWFAFWSVWRFTVFCLRFALSAILCGL